MKLLLKLKKMLPEINLFDYNPHFPPVGKEDKYPDGLYEEYLEDMRNRREQLGKKGYV